MARRTNTISCTIVNTSAKLAEVFQQLNNGDLDFDLALSQIDSIYNEWKQNPGSEKFNELLFKANLADYNFSYDSEANQIKPLSVIDVLIETENSPLFKYRDTAKNKILGKFSRDVFSNLFINRSRLYKGNPYVTSKTQFNLGIVNFKNSLCKQIVKDLNLEDFSDITFFDRSGAVFQDGEFNVIKLLKSSKIGDFLNKKLNKILDDPIKYSSELDTVYTLYAINNFDSLLEKELNGLISLKPELKGSVNNVNYVLETANTSTEYWADDSHEAKDIKNYTSNLAKFIIRLIPRVVNNNGKYVHSLGKYLDPNEIYVLASILKLAEFEYNLIHDNSPISLATDLVNSVKTLFDCRPELPAFKEARLELIDSIESFLWNGDDNNFSISELFLKNYLLDQNILDIESIIDFEAYQSTTPTYMELNDDLSPDLTNFGGMYQGGKILKWNVTEFLFNQLKSKHKKITKEYYNNGNPKDLDSSHKIILTVLTEVLGLDPNNLEIYSNFIKLNLKDLNKLAKGLALTIHNLESHSKSAFNTLKENDDSALYKALSDQADYLIGTNALESYKLSREFKPNYTKLVSEVPITQFTANSGSTIPVNRLNSAITNISWFLKLYKDTLIAEGLNFFVDNPIIFSKYKFVNKQNGKTSLTEWNDKYKGAITYLLGYGNEENYTGFYEMTVADLLLTLFLLNRKLMKDGLFVFLPACFSDKISVGLPTVNLSSVLKNQKTLDSLINPKDSNDTISNIRTLDYKYRKNGILYNLNSILSKWYAYAKTLNGFNAEVFRPFTTEELAFSRIDLIPKLYKSMQEKLTALNNFVLKIGEHNGLDRVKEFGSLNNIDFIEELDFCYLGKQLTLNTSLLNDFNKLKDYSTYVADQDVLLEKLFSSKEFDQLIDNIIQKLLRCKNDDPFVELFINTLDCFSRSYNKKSRQYDVTMKTIDPIKNLLAVQTALSNFLRNQFIDLISKSYYLDKIKKRNSNPNIESAQRIDAMSKRMVLYPATIQLYLPNKIDGVSQEIKVACIEDPKELVWNFNGDNHMQDIFDGCGFISPFYSYMEDNSLPGHGIKGTKKSLGTSTRKTNSTLFKWAGFPITNEKMRNSRTCKFDLQTLFRKMHEIKWTEDIDITQNYLGDSLSLINKLLNKNIYRSDGFDVYRLLSIEKSGLNTYTITEVQSKWDGSDFIDENGDRNFLTRLVKIDSIYSLWQTFGGLNSLEIINGKLENSEASIDATFKYIINVGKPKLTNIRHYDQSNIYQPLRNKFIAIAVNKSAIKRGSANVNTALDAWLTNKPLNTFICNTSCFGIQLDANHHSDLADVREMSLTISTLAGLGYTYNLAEEAYQLIGQLVNISLRKINKYITKLEKEGLESSIRSISEKLVHRLATETKIASTDAFVEMFSDELGTVLPISDRRFYKLFVKEILEDLNKSSIRRRYTGLGGILNPAGNIMLIYDLDGKTYLFSTLLRKARLEITKQKDIRNLLKQYWRSHANSDKDLDIVTYYLYQKANPNQILSNEEFIQVIENRNITKSISIPELNIIKPLDTIRYRLKNTEEWTTKLLELNDIIEFKKFVDQNTNYITGETNVEIELVLNKPHDLRPQNISWTSVNPAVQNLETGEVILAKEPKSVYNTIGARLSRSIGNIKLSESDLDNLIANLAEDGEIIKYNC